MESISRRHCDDLASPGYANFTISILLFLGILISYLPQHYRIVSRRSSIGISPYFVLLGTTSGTCALANILCLEESRHNIDCCKVISGYACFAGVLGIAQVAVQWFCFSVILLFFLVFFPRASMLSPPNKANDTDHLPTYRTALLVALTSVAHVLLTLLISIYLFLSHRDQLQTWAVILGISATILASIQYFPQLWTTYKLRAVGSLSIPMMLIQTPGSFVWVASLAARYGVAGWSSWIIYLVTGCLQGALLAMCIYFELVARRQRRADAARGSNADHQHGHETDDEGGYDVEGDGDERTPLLR
ncbi:MAG: hypothetical protein M1829_001326 [Trizodia sp. TS-e1964]|nr:MAG: hypothetical protein M1829_001326 [Trizodia sp. TS-e1964]